MKESSKKFEGFAHNLIAESLKRWATQSSFVSEKLKERLMNPVDDLDKQIAQIMVDSDGNIIVSTVPSSYEYVQGTTEIKVEKKSRY